MFHQIVMLFYQIFRSLSFKYDGGAECHNCNVRRVTIEIEFDSSLRHDDDSDAEINKQVESVWLIVSCLIIVEDDEYDKVFCCIDDDEYK